MKSPEVFFFLTFVVRLLGQSHVYSLAVAQLWTMDQTDCLMHIVCDRARPNR